MDAPSDAATSTSAAPVSRALAAPPASPEQLGDAELLDHVRRVRWGRLRWFLTLFFAVHGAGFLGFGLLVESPDVFKVLGRWRSSARSLRRST
jgi:hypothetical protein